MKQDQNVLGWVSTPQIDVFKTDLVSDQINVCLSEGMNGTGHQDSPTNISLPLDQYASSSTSSNQKAHVRLVSFELEERDLSAKLTVPGERGSDNGGGLKTARVYIQLIKEVWWG